MEKDTAGNEIWKQPLCHCGSTGGCNICMPRQVIINSPIIKIEEDNEITSEDEKNFYRKAFN